MRKPPFPTNEAARILSLHKTQILDTAAEERFDRITRTAQRMFGVDICLVSLVDSSRQWFKSTQGLEVSETSREISFCGHSILSKEGLVVEDTLKDERFSDNPLVTGEPSIRFYAGIPICGPDNYPLGTLCLIHREPRELSADDRLGLKDMAGLVEDQLRLSAAATIDDLTQVVNRRGFEIIAAQMLEVCKRTNSDAQLLFFDLDDLKAVNDGFGHNFGDDILRQFGNILKLCFRASDLVARIGGDEFVVLLTGQDIDANTALVRLENMAAVANGGQKTKLAWSVGIAKYDSQHTLAELMADADTRMYENKRRRKSLGAK